MRELKRKGEREREVEREIPLALLHTPLEQRQQRGTGGSEKQTFFRFV